MDGDYPSDAELTRLMVAAQGGDKLLYAELLRNSAEIISTTARRNGVSVNLVEAVVEETMLTLHRSRHTYDSTRSFTAWLTTIAQRCASNLLLHQGSRAKRKMSAPLFLEQRG